MATAEASWVTLKEFRALYPAFQLTDELILQGERYHVGYHIPAAKQDRADSADAAGAKAGE
jgi:hypothetical protein